MTDTTKTVNAEVVKTEKKVDPKLLMADLALSQYSANASVNFPEAIIFQGSKIDGSFGTVTLTSEITVNGDDKTAEWFTLTVGYLTEVNATNLNKAPIVRNGEEYKRPKEKITVVRPLITFAIDKTGKISNTPPTNDWLKDTGLGSKYGSLVFPYLSKLLYGWENPLSLLFILLFSKANRSEDTTYLNESTGTANFKQISYEPISAEQRFVTLVEHYEILVGKNHPAQHNFAMTAAKAKKVLAKVAENKAQIEAAAAEPTPTVEPEKTVVEPEKTV